MVLLLLSIWKVIWKQKIKLPNSDIPQTVRSKPQLWSLSCTWKSWPAERMKPWILRQPMLPLHLPGVPPGSPVLVAQSRPIPSGLTRAGANTSQGTATSWHGPPFTVSCYHTLRCVVYTNNYIKSILVYNIYSEIAFAMRTEFTMCWLLKHSYRSLTANYTWLSIFS